MRKLLLVGCVAAAMWALATPAGATIGDAHLVRVSARSTNYSFTIEAVAYDHNPVDEGLQTIILYDPAQIDARSGPDMPFMTCEVRTATTTTDWTEGPSADTPACEYAYYLYPTGYTRTTAHFWATPTDATSRTTNLSWPVTVQVCAWPDTHPSNLPYDCRTLTIGPNQVQTVY
jgi:hypothetical protein